MNLFGFILNCITYLLALNMCFVTMYLSNQAGINVGIITTIWTVFPLYTALADKVMFNTKMEYYHWVGLTSMLICSLLISAQGIIDQMKIGQTKVVVHKLPTWIPVIMGVLTPMTFTIVAILTKYLTSPEVGFNATHLSFSTYTVSNGIVLIIAIFYW